MEYIEKYHQLPKVLRNQLAKVQSVFIDDKDVQRHYHKLKSLVKDHRTLSDHHIKILLRMTIMAVISPRTLFNREWFDVMCCYREDKPKSNIKLTKVIKSGRHVNIIEGSLKNLQVIIKWYESSKRNTQYEIDIYERLKELGCNLPWFSGKFKYWGHTVLVLEKLIPLTQYDDECKIGAHVIDQLRYLHTFGIHCDMKPGNIMKRTRTGKPEYLLIDYGGVALDRLSYGYRRWIWTPRWTSQKQHESNQITTAKHDFIELGYTMKTIQNWRERKDHSDGEFKKGFTGRLDKYMKRVFEINPRHITSKDYDDLIKILSK